MQLRKKDKQQSAFKKDKIEERPYGVILQIYFSCVDIFPSETGS